jgi:integrase
MATSHLQLVTPANEKPAVVSNNPAGRKKNNQYRDGEHSPSEWGRSRDCQRWTMGFRDATMIRLAYRHGLRAKELVELRWRRSIWTRP